MKYVLGASLIHLSLSSYYFQVHVFCIGRNTYSTKWILYSVTAPITPFYTNEALMKLKRIQINKP